MGPEDALAFATDQQQFLPALFRANAALATSAKLWVVAGGRKRELFDSLAAAARFATGSRAWNRRCSLRQQLGYLHWPGLFAMGKGRCTAGIGLD